MRKAELVSSLREVLVGLDCTFMKHAALIIFQVNVELESQMVRIVGRKKHLTQNKFKDFLPVFDRTQCVGTEMILIVYMKF